MKKIVTFVVLLTLAHAHPVFAASPLSAECDVAAGDQFAIFYVLADRAVGHSPTA